MGITVEELRRMSLLEGMEERELRRLAGRMRERTYRAGETVYGEGQGGVGFSFVVDGTAEVSVNGERRGTLKAGDHFGEVALLAPSRSRSATVTATSEFTTASITEWEFRPLLREHPEMAFQLLRQMAARLAARDGSG